MRAGTTPARQQRSLASRCLPAQGTPPGVRFADVDQRMHTDPYRTEERSVVTPTGPPNADSGGRISACTVRLTKGNVLTSGRSLARYIGDRCTMTARGNMANFSDGFLPYLPPSEERTRSALRDGMVVVDTNVLLDAYRYTEAARKELFSALKALGNRLWVPHQVALEFHRNRNKVIASHGDAYGDVAKAISDVKKHHDEELTRRIREFGNRVALDEAIQAELLTLAQWDASKLIERVNAMQADHGVSDRFLRDDPVLKNLQELLDGCVGAPLSADEEAKARNEAEDRISEGRPPGFKDSSKDDPCGDYLLWYQSLIEAKVRSVPLMLVTRDGKADWFLKIKGKSLGALPELVSEALDFAGVDFVAVPTKSFLLHAKAEFGASISQATLAQTDAIRQNANKRRNVSRVHLRRENLTALSAYLDEMISSSAETRSALIHELHASKGKAPSEDVDITETKLQALNEKLRSLTALKDRIEEPEHFHDNSIAIISNLHDRALIEALEQDHGVRYILEGNPGRVLHGNARRPDRSVSEIMDSYERLGIEALAGMPSRELRRFAAIVIPEEPLPQVKSHLIHRLDRVLSAGTADKIGRKDGKAQPSGENAGDAP
jgi:predicted nucleic acid-binding protein